MSQRFSGATGAPKTLVIGAKGFIGSHFFHFYRNIYSDCIGTHYLPALGLKCLDLRCPIPFFSHLNLEGYAYALIAGGICNPKECEAFPEKSYHINVEGIFSLCSFLLKKSITPIFISSGYVFNGEKGNYVETDPTSPINAYGIQKCALESKLLKEFENLCLIVRVAKVYGMCPGDKTLLDEIASSLYFGKETLAAHDQILSPISIWDVVKAISYLQKQDSRGLYHLGGPDTLSRYDLAVEIAEALKLDAQFITGISLDNLSSNFKRAKRTDLISQKLHTDTGIHFTSIHDNVVAFAHQFERDCLRNKGS